MINISDCLYSLFDVILSHKDYNYNFCRKANPFLYSYILTKIYNRNLNLKLNLRHPKNFTEKIQWLKLYDNSPLKTKLTDKLSAKDWVKENIPFIKIPKVFTSGKTFESLDLSACPEHFVLKANHGCKMNELVTDKSLFGDKEIYDNIKKYFTKILKVDYEFVSGFEMQYRGIDKKLYCEEWLDFPNKILDYKIHCFNGEPKFIDYMVSDKEKNQTDLVFYDTNWNKTTTFFGNISAEDFNIPCPENLEIMFEASKIIAKHFRYVRVDLYNINGEIYFAEATFSPFSGFILFNKPEYNLIWGEMLKL